MGRLRIRDPKNVRWLDICQSEFYVRNAANTAWYRLLPAKGLNVRHGGGNYWIPIGCTTDDPELICPDEYGGTPDGNGENGSGPGNTGGGGGGDTGTGTGTGGGGGGGGGGTNNGGDSNNDGNVDFDPDKPYKPGYGLDLDSDSSSDDGSSNNEIIDTGDGDLVVLDPDSGNVETFDPGDDGNGGPGSNGGGGGGGLGSDGKAGTYDNPHDCPVSLSGRGNYHISEFYVDMGAVSGTVKVHYSFVGGRGQVTAYHGGRKMKETSKTTGRGVMKFEYNTANARGDQRVLYRVRADAGVKWTVLVQCPTTEEQDDYGTPSKPATCRGTFQPSHGGGAGVHEYTHTMGKAGRVVIEYQMWYQPDKMDVLYQGRVIASTNSHVAGEGRLVFNFTPNGADTDVQVRITSLDGTTSWVYIINCPDEKGSSLDPKPCGADSATTSGGAGVTDTYFDMADEPAGQMAVRYQMWNIPDKMEVYQNGTLVATTTNPVAGENRLFFNYNPATGTQLRVRVIGPDNNTSWSFLLECPSDMTPPTIDAGNVSVREGNSGATAQMCFPITLSKPSSTPVTVDYAVGGGTASGVVANARVLATDQYDIPFAAIVEQSGVGRLAMDGGFPKFYNGGWVEPLPPPTSDTVFNSWHRMANEEYYTSNATTPAGSEAKAWSYNASTGVVSSTTNSSKYIGFLSPTEYDAYVYEVTLGSPDADNDTVGVVVAFEREGSVNHSIMACRNTGGVTYAGGNQNWGLFYAVDGVPTTLIAQKTVGNSGSGWGGKYTRVRVDRSGDVIKVTCSPFNSTAIDPASELSVDLNSSSNYTRFKGATRWGFCAQSQDGAYFKDILFEGIGMAPQFVYLKNVVKWMVNPALNPKKVWVICDANTATYSMDTAATSFGIGVPKAIESLGYTVDVTGMYTYGNPATIPLSKMQEYAGIVLIGSRVGSSGLTTVSVDNFAQYVATGGGLFLVTDHDVFQHSVNPIAKKFNAEFYGSVDRGPTSVDAMITKHGDHPIWDGLDGKTIFAGGSEGGIRITTTVSDYTPQSGKVTFAPGETSKTVCVPLAGDDTSEADETVQITLTNPSGGTIGTSTGTGTIINDDSPLCRLVPNLPVYESPSGSTGHVIHVQPNLNCAGGNTTYTMVRDFTFPTTGIYNFTFHADDTYELYIDCKQVLSGGIGVFNHTLSVTQGQHYLILRYTNVPNCTPSYVGMRISQGSTVIMETRAADWAGAQHTTGVL